METFMYTPKDYYPAICLALNHAAGGLEIHDYMYDEDKDIWFVELTNGKYYDHAFQLDGSFVRSCYKATKEGITSWMDTKAA